MARLVLESVSKVYLQRVAAVQDLNLEVRDEELLVLLGPSGCGKTTTLRLIAGLERPTAGTIRIGDTVVNDVSARSRNVALVFQQNVLPPHWTVRKNLAFGLKLRYGGHWFSRAFRRLIRPAEAAALVRKRREIPDLVRRTAAMLGLESLLDRKAGELSGGERQRVALGKAMVRQPAAFLFDEPLSSLDAPLREEIRGELKRLHRELRATMVYVTHDQAEALRLGDRIAVMRAGRVEQIGTPGDVWNRPRNKFVAEFVRQEPLNICRGRLVSSRTEAFFQSDNFCLRLVNANEEKVRRFVGRDVELGIRPEDVKVCGSPPMASEAMCPGIEARVDEVESLGEAALVTVSVETGEAKQTPAVRLVCKTEARTNVKVGDRVWVKVDATRTQLFDGGTGENLLLME